MKAPITAVLALVGAVTVVADDFPANMPPCGKLCGTNMLAKADELGCPANDIVCLCKNVNFGYGIRDCSVQVCRDIEQANIAINWGKNLCANAGVTVSIPPAPSAHESTTGSATPITTSTAVTTITSDDETIVKTFVTTIFGTGAAPSENITPTAQSTVTSAIVSTLTSGSETIETTVGTTTAAPSTDPSEAPPADVETESSSAQGAQMTAAPALGILAAAGIAAALL